MGWARHLLALSVVVGVTGCDLGQPLLVVRIHDIQPALPGCFDPAIGNELVIDIFHPDISIAWFRTVRVQ